MQTGSLSVDGCDLYYEEAGGGPPVLLIHGAGAYGGLFAPCVAELKPTHRVFSYDRRSCSRSAYRPVNDIRTHVGDATRLIEERIAQPTVVVGWSAGSIVALHLAISRPDLVPSLVLAEPPLLLRAPRPLALGAMARWQVTRSSRGPEAGARVFYRWVSQYRDGGNAFDTYPEEWQTQMLRNAGSLFAEIGFGAGALGEKLRRSDLASLQLPVQILLGERSAAVFGPAARYLDRVLPHSELVAVPEAGHMVPTDRPDRVAAAVRSASTPVVLVGDA